MSEALESWKNDSKGRVVLRRFNQRGDLTSEMVAGGRLVHLSPQERRINQELAATQDLDPFYNGTLTPVRLLADEEDTADIESNPNHIGEDDMRALYKGAWKSFDGRVGQISNPVVLERMLEIGLEVDATIRQIDVVKNRIAELNPTDVTEIVHAGN